MYDKVAPEERRLSRRNPRLSPTPTPACSGRVRAAVGLQGHRHAAAAAGARGARLLGRAGARLCGQPLKEGQPLAAQYQLCGPPGARWYVALWTASEGAAFASPPSCVELEWAASKGPPGTPRCAVLWTASEALDPNPLGGAEGPAARRAVWTACEGPNPNPDCVGRERASGQAGCVGQ